MSSNNFSQANLTAIKAYIVANMAALKDSGQSQEIARLMNLAASPVFTVWKTNVSLNDVGKAFNGTELAGLTSTNQTRLQTLGVFLAGGVNPSLADNRAFFDDVFSGAGGATTRASLLVLWKRSASLVEKICATGTGSDAVPATLTYEGQITPYWVDYALVNG